MSYLQHQPGGSLRSLVQSIWTARYDTPNTELPGLIAPDAHLEFVFHLGAPCEMRRAGSTTWESLPQAMLYAQRHACVRLRSTSPSIMVALRTSAGVAAIILGRSMQGLWDQPVSLRDLLGPPIETLSDELAGLSARDRLSLIEDWVRKRLSRWDADHSRIEQLHEQLFWRSSGAPIRSTATALGMSLRSMRRWIGAPTGLSPKQLELSGRILRACALLREAPGLSITQIAQQLGFADHAAFTNAFQSHAAMTPSAFREEPLVFYERGPV